MSNQDTGNEILILRLNEKIEQLQARLSALIRAGLGVINEWQKSEANDYESLVEDMAGPLNKLDMALKGAEE